MKVTGSLSDGLSRLVDDEHEKARRDIMSQRAVSGRSHIAAGVRGFAHGIYGGLTGVFTQPVKHVVKDGIEVRNYSRTRISCVLNILHLFIVILLHCNISVFERLPA